jgi:NitT/TauT family transport system substrate-binding protein
MRFARKALTAATVGVLAVTAACSSGGGASGGSSSGGLTKLTIVTGLPTLDVTNSPVFIAQKLGFYKKLGLDVSFQALPRGGSGLFPLIAGGGADIGLPSMDAFYGGVKTGANTGLIAVYQFSRASIYNDFAVYANSPVTSYAQLAGKTVGIDQNQASSTVFPDQVLAQQHLSTNKVNYLAVGFSAAAGQALKDNKVQALALWDTAYAALQTQGFNLRQLPKVSIPAVGSSLVVRKTYLSGHKDILEKLARGIAEGTVYALANPTAAIRVYEQMFPNNTSAAVTPSQRLANDTKIFDARAPKWDPQQYPQTDPRLGAFSASVFNAAAKNAGVTGVNWSSYYTNQLIGYANDFSKPAIQAEAKSQK